MNRWQYRAHRRAQAKRSWDAMVYVLALALVYRMGTEGALESAWLWAKQNGWKP